MPKFSPSIYISLLGIEVLFFLFFFFLLNFDISGQTENAYLTLFCYYLDVIKFYLQYLYIASLVINGINVIHISSNNDRL
jgi:hypothetical protein